MALKIVEGNLLDSATDAVLLTLDGSKSGLEGNIARQFSRRFPEDWEYLQRAIKYPIPIGRTVIVPWDGDCHWRYILFASTLHHFGVLNDHEKLRVIRMALTEALRLCLRHGATSLSTAVLQGGWRLDAESALREMRTAYDGAGCPQVRLQIYVASTEKSNEIPKLFEDQP